MCLNNEKYAIFLDIDGTLMGSSDDALARNIDVIQNVRELGHKVFLNTGRSTAYLPKNIDIEKHFDGFISGAGSRVVIDRKEIFSKPVELASVQSFCRVCFDLENECIIEGTEEMYCVEAEENKETRWQCITRENVDQIVKNGMLVEKFTLLGQCPQEVGEALGDGFIVMQHGGYAEIVQAGYTKAGAIAVVLDALNIKPENSIAMGDSLNDYDMIEKAGIGVAMGNAIEEIKNIATFVTGHVNDAGVATALEKIFGL